MPDEDLVRVLDKARGEPLVCGFAIGRTIFSDAAKQWFAGRCDDEAAHDMMVAVFERLIAAWNDSGA